MKNGQEIAATFIQAQWRSYDTRLNYINILGDILMAQSIARRWLTQKRLRSWLTLKKLRRQTKRFPEEYRREQRQRNDQIQANCKQSVQNAQKNNAHTSWQQHRLQVVSKPASPHALLTQQATSGEEGWYDGSKSEASDMLRSWKGRKSK